MSMRIRITASVLKAGDYLVAVDGKNVSDDDFDEFLDIKRR